MSADVGITHLALYLRAGNKGRNGVDNDNIKGARAHESLGYLKSLLAVIRLRDKQSVNVNAEI